MARVVFERYFEAPVESVWELLTNPERMNEWSVAPVSTVEASDPRSPGGGRVVRVSKFGVTLQLREETVAVDRPSRFEYRVLPNPIVRSHRAEQRLTSEAGGTRLEWEVRIQSWVPGLMALLVKAMRPQLEASLDRLQAIAERPVR